MSEASQKLGMSLQAFAIQEGITYRQANYLAKRGRIMCAQKSRRGDWLVFPPAKLTEPLRKRTTWRDRDANETAAASLAVDFGTSPHGLSAVTHRPLSEASRAAGSHSLADGFAFEVGEEVDALASTSGANLPAIFTSPKVSL